jgi:DUF971 family protein
MVDTARVPKMVRAPRGGEIVEIDWADGHTSPIPNALLRGYCPCAGCQGHSGAITFRPGGNSVIDDIDEVGNYGLSFTWGDGHASGIYQWAYLRRLCQCASCKPGSSAAAGEPLDRA